MTKRALVLGGGGARGAFQVGMLQVLVQQHDFQIIRGVSAGAMNAAVLAQAPTGPDSHTNLQAQVGTLAELWCNDIRGNDSVYKERTLGAIPSLLSEDSLYTIEPARALMKRYVDVERLRSSRRDFKVGAVSLCSGRYSLYGPDDPHFMDKLVASMSLPPAFPPVDIAAEGDVLIDGGMRNITPLSSAFAAGANEIYVLLTSEVLQQGGRIPECSIEAMDYGQWSERDRKVDITLKDVLGRSIGLLMDEIYLEDIKTALQWNNMALGVRELRALVDRYRGTQNALTDAIEGALGKYKSLQRRYAKVHVLAPRQRFKPDEPKGSQDLCTRFEPPLIEAAIAHGREIAMNPELWLWGPEDDLRQLERA
jgi:NTE family protein